MAHKILIIQTAFLGDLLLSIPLMKWIRKKNPGLSLDLVCRKSLGQFFLDQRLVDRIFEVQKSDSDTYKKVIAELKDESYDICISPHQSFRTAMFVRKIRAKKKIGFKTWWNRFIFTERVVRNLKLPDALRQLSLLSASDIDLTQRLASFQGENSDEVPSDFSMAVEPFEISDDQIRKFGEIDFFLLAPGSQWATKRWGVDGFVSVARNIRAMGNEVVLVGLGKDDVRINSEISDQVSGSIDLTNRTTLTELTYLMKRARGFVCNDSGLMHLASVVDLPTVAIFGPTTQELGYRPWQNHALVVEKQLFCRPCGKHGHNRCPLGTHECMRGISSDSVFKALRQFLT